MMTRVSKRFIFLSFHPAINQSKPTELLSDVTKDLSGEAGNPELPIECRKTHGLPRKPLGQPVLVNIRRSRSGNAAVQDVCNQMARSTPFDDSGSSRQAASPTMNQPGCAVRAAMRQVTSAPLDRPTRVRLRKLAGTQLG